MTVPLAQLITRGPACGQMPSTQPGPLAPLMQVAGEAHVVRPVSSRHPSAFGAHITTSDVLAQNVALGHSGNPAHGSEQDAAPGAPTHIAGHAVRSVSTKQPSASPAQVTKLVPSQYVVP